MPDVMMNTVPLTNGTLAVGTTNVLAFFAPTDALGGGGITITRVGVSSNAAIAAASAPQFTLVTLGTNSAINGTICTALASAAYTAGTVREMTVATAFVDAAYGVAFVRAQTAANADIPIITGFIQYVMGR
jgi:hypothetical protein